MKTQTQQPPRKKPVPESLREDMKPRPFPVEGSGLSLYATPLDLANLQAALDEEGLLVVLHRLLRADIEAINAAAPHCLMNPDFTPWVGDVDSLPLSVMELGNLLADVVHRRIFGRQLTIEAGPDA
ncbi:hypothetical protein [Mesorhizobium sp. B2-3-5]|uniref:hypothetical protein n=1 Tax=Mesorhizobium sp. B2-3-5 TaxID=2589958 RepID=UPI00112C6F5B|nr:hypothetical protein [Mesorhizobium sp. B2-3-5]TPM36626.1 hypothetical protein FJ958_02035 [Mesorhizobium sp. B2-3-5]